MKEHWSNHGYSEHMATLNIKNLPDALYRKLQARARRERRSVAQEVIKLLSEALEPPGRLSILDLKGLGKDHWSEIDAAEHVRKERAAWD
jgi:plasmid stability protein